MKKILIVSGSDSSLNSLSQLTAEVSELSSYTAKSAAKAIELFNKNDFDLVLINAPLPDQSGEELAENVAKNTCAGILFLLADKEPIEKAKTLEDLGVFVLGKPINKTLFLQAMRLALSAAQRLQGLKCENQKLQSKIETTKLVERAKFTLITCLKMTEPEAHRYIEKQAMDLRLSRREIAENVLKIYET